MTCFSIFRKGNRSIKKQLCVIFCLIFVCLLVACKGSADNNTITNHDFTFISDTERIVSGCAGNLDVFVTTDKGNCYISGSRLAPDRSNGIENIDAYNTLVGSPFVCMYDGGDAEKVTFNQYGGAIIIANDSVYLFLNNSEHYKVPTYFASGYQDAVVFQDRIYLLSASGELGYMKINNGVVNSDEYHTVGENIKKFIIENKDDVHYAVFSQSVDQKLFILEPDEDIGINTPYIEGVADFDVKCSDTTSVVFTITDTDGNAYAFIGNKPLSYSSFKEIKSSQVIGSDTESVTAFGKCVAMTNSKGQLSLYGYDFYSQNLQPDFVGEVILDHVDTVIGGNNNLYAVIDDLTLHRFGRNPSTGDYDMIKGLN